MISSSENSKYKLLSKLNIGKHRKKEGKFIVEGSHLVEEAKKAGVLIEAYSIVEKEGFTLIDESLMRKLCNTDTVVKEIGLCSFIKKEDMTSKILILDGVQDPGNMGALMRSACAFGFKTMFIGNGCVDIYNDKVIRSSQGAIFKLNFIFGNCVDFIDKIKEEYMVLGTNVERGVSLSNVNKVDKMAIILGNEGNGVSQEVNDLMLNNIYIPMDDTESLNVAIAGSIIMYELREI